MNDRTCIVTRESGSAQIMMRFVVSPEGALVLDIKGNLPGRGAWVKASQQLLQKAVKTKAFQRSFQRDITISEDLVHQTDELLCKNALQSLSLARKSGLVVSGLQKVDEAIRNNKVAMILHASEAAEDGKRKIAQAIHANSEQRIIEKKTTEQSNFEYENSENESLGLEINEIPVISFFTGDDLGLAFGDAHVIHVAILKGTAAKSFIQRAQKLLSYRDGND